MGYVFFIKYVGHFSPDTRYAQTAGTVTQNSFDNNPDKSLANSVEMLSPLINLAPLFMFVALLKLKQTSDWTRNGPIA